MLVEYTVQTGGARFITTRLLASPVQSFLSRSQWVFLLRFRFLQFRLIELLNLSHIGLVRHCCRGRGVSCERAKSGLLLWPPPSALDEYFLQMINSIRYFFIIKH